MAYGEGLHRNRCGVWCWRWVVPADLRQAVGSHEVSRSLRTASRREAVAAALRLRVATADFLAVVRSDRVMTDEAKKKAMLDMLADGRVHARRLVAREDAEHDASEKDDRDRADQRTEQRHAGLLHHAVATTAASTAAATAAAIEASRAKPMVGPVLSVCAAEFVSEKVATKVNNQKTVDRLRYTLRLLVEGLGDRPINQIQRTDITGFLERLQRLPVNAEKKLELKGRGFLALTDARGHPVISEVTAREHMVRVAGFFAWAVRLAGGIPSMNPCDRLNLKVKKRPTPPRRPFTEAELIALFSHPSWSARTFLHSHYFWLMPIALLTGMRLNEICQLHLVDFISIEGVDAINCTEDGPAQRLKNTGASRRVVPIHRELVRLGLLRHVERPRKAGEEQLFPELKPGRDGHGQLPSKWFGKYSTACGVASSTTVFHSFRHFFTSARINDSIPEFMVNAIIGHAMKSESTDTYWTHRDPKKLLEVVNRTTLPASVLALIPTIEEVEFKKVVRRPPDRTGATKSREQRIADRKVWNEKKAKKALAAAAAG